MLSQEEFGLNASLLKHFFLFFLQLLPSFMEPPKAEGKR